MKEMSKATNKTVFSTKQMVVLALLSALAYVLMLFPFPIKFLGFLELEFSDVPAIIATLSYGPIGGVVVELIKNVIKAMTASTTAGIGELANFVIISAYMVPLGILFRKLKTRHKAVVSFVVAVLGFVIAGIIVNYFVTVPLYAKLFGGIDNVVGAAAATIPAIKDLATVVIIGITPFNVVKGILISVTGYAAYKAFYRVIK
ncbi:MAG: riboflavin transporter [Clostridiales bacterium]|nr:riboflavin transporter [Clostridiales bacterium]